MPRLQAMLIILLWRGSVDGQSCGPGMFEIVSDGLMLYLDAKIKESWGDQGTTWLDRSHTRKRLPSS